MKTKDLTDKQIEEQINALEEENANTKRLSMGRGHGWGEDAIERRRNQILHLDAILFARQAERTKPTPKKEGLSRTWDSKAKRWVYHYTKRTKKAKKQPDTKLSQREKWLLAGEYKVRGKPKDVRGLGKHVRKELKKTKNIPKKGKGMKTIPKDYSVQEVLGGFDIYFHHEYIGTRPTREAAIKYIKAHKNSHTKPKPKKKKRTKAKPHQRTLFGGL